jgi:ATP-dependent protease ClpP protease subunit
MNNKTLGRNDSDDDFTMSMRSEPLGYTVKSQQLNNFSVHITGDIRDAEYYTKIFELCLDAGENDIINFFIASNGGDLDGLNVLLEGIRITDAHVRAILVGACHSAASILAMNVHDVIVTDSCTMLVHGVRTGFGGKMVDLDDYALLTGIQIR